MTRFQACTAGTNRALKSRSRNGAEMEKTPADRYVVVVAGADTVGVFPSYHDFARYAVKRGSS